jgi:hypothetical protein
VFNTITSYTKIISVERTNIFKSNSDKIAFNDLINYNWQDTSTKQALKRITNAKNYQTICGGITITVSYQIVPSCPYEANGSISVDLDSTKGGRAPYLISFEGEKFSTICTYANLSKGEYRIRIKDQSGCLSSLITIHLDDEECDPTIHKSFTPSKGEVMRIDFNKAENGKLKIINKEGTCIYSTSIRSTSYVQWNGKTDEGTFAEPDVYIYELNLNTEEKRIGQITITP